MPDAIMLTVYLAGVTSINLRPLWSIPQKITVEC